MSSDEVGPCDVVPADLDFLNDVLRVFPDHEIEIHEPRFRVWRQRVVDDDIVESVFKVPFKNEVVRGVEPIRMVNLSRPPQPLRQNLLRHMIVAGKSQIADPVRGPLGYADRESGPSRVRIQRQAWGIHLDIEIRACAVVLFEKGFDRERIQDDRVPQLFIAKYPAQVVAVNLGWPLR